MLNRIFLILISTILISEAAEFLDYERAFRFSTSYSGRMDDRHGFSFGLNYENRVGKSLIEFNLTTKFLFDIHDYSYLDTYPEGDTTFNNNQLYSSDYGVYSLETSILFSHRPAIRLKDGPGSFTYNLWRYGVCFEWDIFEDETFYENGYITEESVRTNAYQKRIGLIYKPAVGVQLTKRLNLSLEITYSAMGDFSQYFLPVFSYGAGISLAISNPVSGF